MEYEVKVDSYKRLHNKKSRRRIGYQSDLKSIILMSIIGIALSRVNLEFIEGLTIAPFGIAYLISIILKRDKKEYIVAGIAVVIGYLTMYKKLDGSMIYIAIVVINVLYAYVYNIFDKNIRNRSLFLISIIIYVGLGGVYGNQGALVNGVFSLIEALAIIPFFYIINYGISCLSEIKTNYIYSLEELISMALILCFIIAGIGNIEIVGIDIRNVLALSIIVVFSYIGGSSIGTVLGVTMGVIVGITNNDLLNTISIYSVCGLVVGIFKEAGRIFAVIAYIVAYLLITLYSQNIGMSNFIELVAPGVALLIIPKTLIRNILSEVSNEEKNKNISEIQVQGIKEEFVDRLEALKSILATISVSMNNLSENDNLLLKNKSVALVENLADRVCSGCELKNKCWGRELHSTFSIFGDLIGSYESGKIIIPKELDSKCVKLNTLLKNTENILNNYTVNESLKNRLIEGRKLIANQVNNMSIAMDDIVKDFEKDVSNCLEVDKLLRKTLSRNKIKYNNLYAYTDRNGRLKIKIKRENCEGCNYCIKNVLPAINDLIKVPLSLNEDGCRINPITDECTFVIEETQKYNILSYAAFVPKDGEKYSGDTFSFGKNKNGLYITALSDGMGSGPEAGAESNITVSLIEKFTELGFDETTSLNTINSIMGMKFNEDEKFTTLDMNTIDLYTGDVSFVKVGGVVSFIKRGNQVEVVENTELPFGIIDRIEVNKVNKKIKHGDIIISISDGILDADKNNNGNYEWLKKYLENGTNNPELLSRDILDKAKAISNGRVYDDMTVVVSKAYSIY